MWHRLVLLHCRRLLLAESVNEEQILEQAFMFFDRDGNKEISIAELTTTMKELGDLLTAEEITTFVTIMDKNADGVVGVSGVHCSDCLLWSKHGLQGHYDATVGDNA